MPLLQGGQGLARLLELILSNWFNVTLGDQKLMEHLNKWLEPENLNFLHHKSLGKLTKVTEDCWRYNKIVRPLGFSVAAQVILFVFLCKGYVICY
jgi:hypothetical protein